MYGITRRSLLSLPLALPMIGRSASAAEPPVLPILPLATNFSFWEHHWIHWLDGHPLYEAIEVALGAPLPSGDPLVRLWFTERAGGKRQTYYFNDAAIARSFAQESHFVPIRVSHGGAQGAPQNLSLGFTDKSGTPVRWELRFPPAQPLSRSGAGLKPQNGHAAHSVLLFWYIDAGAITPDSGCTIGAIEYRPKADAPPQRRYNAAYSSGAYSAVLAYAPNEVTTTPEGFRTSWAGRNFVRDNARYVARFEAFRRPASVELRCAPDNALLGYRHTQGSHALALDFDAALSVPGKAVGFELAIDGNHVAGGTVTPAADGSRLAWEFTDPEWAQQVGLATTIERRPAGYATRITTLR
jgi:hypothetical protein